MLVGYAIDGHHGVFVWKSRSLARSTIVILCQPLLEIMNVLVLVGVHS